MKSWRFQRIRGSGNQVSLSKDGPEISSDRNPGDKEAEERFKEAAEAYSVLTDAEKKQLYDRFGHEGLAGSGFSGFSGFEDIFSNFGDVFEGIFGFGGAAEKPGPGKGRA